MNQMQKTVLSYEKLAKKIHNRSSEKKKVLAYLKEMASELTETSIGAMRKVLEATLIKLYDGINFQVPEDLNLPKLVKENNVIFVLNHQSHADYLIFNYVLYVHHQICSYIAGGINLNIFPIGKFFRMSGCFFIRRSFQNDILYKLTLEAYLSHLLLNEDRPIEFFFEGGRSRTGRLLPPKFGLFQMLLETHSHLPNPKPLLFVPVSIVHELVPEQKALAQELGGKQKERENFLQLVKLYKFLSRKFGTVHIKMSHPIEMKGPFEDIKKTTQNLAFDCFREVGKGMVVTPSSILALILLDAPTGAITWEDIKKQVPPILDYCSNFKIPLPPSLQNDNWEDSIGRALNMFMISKKIKKVDKKKLNQSFYVIEEGSRMEILYFKNTILHHFLVPFFINSSLPQIFIGRIKNAQELKNFLLAKRKELKYEFYLPTLKELFFQGLSIVYLSTGIKVDNLDDIFKLSAQNLSAISSMVGPFSNAFRYIYEGHYIAALTLKHLKTAPFSREEFNKAGREIFEMEIFHGRFIRYSESYTQSIMKTAFSYFLNLRLMVRDDGKFKVEDVSKVEEMITHYAKDLTDLLISNLKTTSSHWNQGGAGLEGPHDHP